jgi:hypothetical protein
MQPSTNGSHKHKPAGLEVGPDGDTRRITPPPLPGNPSAPTEDERLFDALRGKLDVLLSRHDFAGIGNVVIETLMRPGQETVPDALSKYLDEFIAGVIQERHEIPPGLTYGRPWPDKHISFRERGQWQADRFRELLCDAYMLGSTIKCLPPPHDDARLEYALAGAEKAVEITTALQQRHYVPPFPYTLPVGSPGYCDYREWSARVDPDHYQLQVAQRALHTIRREYYEARQSKEIARERREAEERAEAEAGRGESELASQIREILNSGMDASLINAEIEFLVKNSKSGVGK